MQNRIQPYSYIIVVLLFPLYIFTYRQEDNSIIKTIGVAFLAMFSNQVSLYTFDCVIHRIAHAGNLLSG